MIQLVEKVSLSPYSSVLTSEFMKSFCESLQIALSRCLHNLILRVNADNYGIWIFHGKNKFVLLQANNNNNNNNINIFNQGNPG